MKVVGSADRMIGDVMKTNYLNNVFVFEYQEISVFCKLILLLSNMIYMIAKYLNVEHEYVFKAHDFSSFRYAFRKAAREFSFMSGLEVTSRLLSEELTLPYTVTIFDNFQNDATDEDKMTLHFQIEKDYTYIIVSDGKQGMIRQIFLEVAKNKLTEDDAEVILKKYNDKKVEVERELFGEDDRDVPRRNIDTIIPDHQQLDEIVLKSPVISKNSRRLYNASKKLHKDKCVIL